MAETNPKNTHWAIVAVLVVGLALGAAILATDGNKAVTDEHGHAAHPEAPGHAEEEHHGQAKSTDHADDASHADEEHHEAAAEPAKGPHGGKLLTDGRYGIEVTIFETGAEPQFRLYTYWEGKPLDVAQSQIQLVLERLGQSPQRFSFIKEGDYLKGDAVVAEPHSFAVKVQADYEGKRYQLGYEQVEARVTMTDAQLQELEAVAHKCPVHKLMTAVTTEIATTVERGT